MSALLGAVAYSKHSRKSGEKGEPAIYSSGQYARRVGGFRPSALAGTVRGPRLEAGSDASVVTTRYHDNALQ